MLFLFLVPFLCPSPSLGLGPCTGRIPSCRWYAGDGCPCIPGPPANLAGNRPDSLAIHPAARRDTVVGAMRIVSVANYGREIGVGEMGRMWVDLRLWLMHVAGNSMGEKVLHARVN